MRGLFVSAVAAFGVFAFACNPEPPKKAKVVMVGDSTPKKDTSASDTSGDDDDSAETAPPADESTSPENTDDTTKPSDPNTPPTTPSTPQPKDCEAKVDGNTSTTNVMYVEKNGDANISSMTVTIANKNHRNKNDVDVYLTPNGGKETF